MRRGAHLLRIRDPKPRVICCVPVEDRVVHTALVLLLTPTLTRPLRPEAMACRPGLGAHRAVLALWGLLRRYRYALHLDIRAYFPSSITRSSGPSSPAACATAPSST